MSPRKHPYVDDKTQDEKLATAETFSIEFYLAWFLVIAIISVGLQDANPCLLTYMANVLFSGNDDVDT